MQARRARAATGDGAQSPLATSSARWGMRRSPLRGSSGGSIGELGADLVQERLRVERVEAEPARDLLACRLRALEKQIGEKLARLRVPPPVLAHLARQVLAQLRRTDPGAQVVGRVEACVHVREVVVLPVADARRVG